MEVVPEVFEAAGWFELNRRFLNTGLEFLDSVDLQVVFRTRALVMKSVPILLKGAFKAALICAMRDGNNQGHDLRAERGWKMLMLLPRMLLARPRGGKVSKKKLQERIDLFTSGQWQSLLDVSDECARAGVVSKVRASRRPRQDNIQSGVQRAEALVQMGELSARFLSADVALGNLATLAQLTDPDRRPPIPRDHLSGSHSARMCVLLGGALHRAHLA